MEIITITTSLLLILVSIAAILLRQWRTHVSRRLPPGPWGVPLLGSLPFLDPNLHHYFAGLTKAYGPIVSLRLGTKLHVAISSPTAAGQVLKEHDIVFANHAVPALALVATGTENILWAPYGSFWRMVRKVAVREVLSTSAIDSFRSLRQREIHRMLGKLQSSVGIAVSLRETAFSAILNVMLGMVWEDALKEEKGSVLGKELMEVIDSMAELLGKPNIADFFPVLAPFDLQGLHRRMKVLSERSSVIFDSIIRQRVSSTKAHVETGVKDFLQLLLDLVERKDPEMPLEIKHAKVLLLDMIFAGTETTSTTVEWTMSELIRNPQKMAKVQNELDSVVGRGCIVEESHIPNLPYLHAVLKESLRLHPVLPLLVPHTPSKDCNVGGYTIPEGASVSINMWAIQRDPSLWEEPLEFRPERFLEHKERWETHGKSFEYIPFGSGRRICAGANLGEKMAMHTLACLVHSFEWQLPQGTKVVEVDDKFSLVLKKKDPLVLVPYIRGI